jgi:hypothetical protein
VRIQRGTLASARLVAQLLAPHGASTCAIEFLDQRDTAKNFWGISFPTRAEPKNLKLKKASSFAKSCWP